MKHRNRVEKLARHWRSKHLVAGGQKREEMVMTHKYRGSIVVPFN
jgi:hypothetical protein